MKIGLQKYGREGRKGGGGVWKVDEDGWRSLARAYVYSRVALGSFRRTMRYRACHASGKATCQMSQAWMGWLPLLRSDVRSALGPTLHYCQWPGALSCPDGGSNRYREQAVQVYVSGPLLSAITVPSREGHAQIGDSQPISKVNAAEHIGLFWIFKLRHATADNGSSPTRAEDAIRHAMAAPRRRRCRLSATDPPRYRVLHTKFHA
jgi:hypothetical protein